MFSFKIYNNSLPLSYSITQYFLILIANKIAKLKLSEVHSDTMNPSLRPSKKNLFYGRESMDSCKIPLLDSKWIFALGREF